MKSLPTKIISLGVRITMVIIIAIILFLYLQDTQEFTYFYREQNQLFLWDTQVISKMLFTIGGLCKVMAQVLVQYFVLAKMGAVITTLICLIGAHFLWCALKNLCNNWFLVPVCFLPFVIYNVYIMDNYAKYEGIIALCILAIFFWIHTLLNNQNNYIRLGISCILTLIVYLLFGSVALLLSFCVLIYELILSPKKGLLFVAPIILVLAVGLIAVNQAYLIGFGQAYGMQHYTEYYFEPTGFYSFSWIITIAIIPIFWLLGKSNIKALWLQSALAIILTAFLPYLYNTLGDNHQDKGMYSLERIIHYADTEQWDEIIALGHSETSNYINLNYLNLALSKKGQLLEKLFQYEQNSSQAVFLDYQQFTDIGVLRARQYYQMGVIGASQMNAVSAKMSMAEGSPSMQQLIIKNYIITGRYKIAEKYIQELEKTWYYADWATSMRKYLYNDKAVESDPELGMKRRDLPRDNETFTIYAGIFNDTQTVMTANPEETSAADYAIACMLLDKNFNYIIPFTQFNYENGYWKELPERLQEAILTAQEQNMDFAKQFGISDEMIERFAQFRKDALNLRHNGGAVTQLASRWGNTFWYYMLRNKGK